ncbi:MAG: ATP-binding protein, partial [Chloroflexi bacterium]|nr:ATP-binding protein [Chloroflexota bacterium]
MSESVASPYVGLRPYAESERAYFFGRESERRVIVASMLAARVTVLYGASAVGKTSLLRAGILPYLRALPDVHVIALDDWHANDLLHALRRTIADANETDAAVQDTSLAELLAARSGRDGRSIALVLDESEHLLQSPSADAFAAELAELVRRDVNANVLLVLRAEHPDELTPLNAHVPDLLRDALRLDPLTRSEAERAIRKPLDVYNAQFNTQVGIDDALVEELLNLSETTHTPSERAGASLAASSHVNESRVEAAYLQLLLTRLWQTRTDDSLTAEGFEYLGGARAITREHLDSVMRRFDAPAQQAFATVFPHLVTPTGKRVEHTLDDASAYAELPPNDVMPLLQALDEARVLRTLSSAHGAPRYEVFHPLIAPAVLDWARGYSEEQESQREELRRGAVERERAQVEERIRQVEEERARAEAQRDDARAHAAQMEAERDAATEAAAQ